MTQAKSAKTSVSLLPDRGVVSVTGPDCVKFLQGLVTNNVESTTPGEAAFAALLSPQGKILCDFLAVRTPDGFLLDVARDAAAALEKRLAMYKLRAAVVVSDLSEQFDVIAEWGAPTDSEVTVGSVAYRDPRHSSLGFRVLLRRQQPLENATHSIAGPKPPWDDYHAHRIALSVPEGGKDYDFADAYPHEADFDIFNGVSFTKGCYVGQEIVARMQHKAVVRKRVVPVVSEFDLPAGRPDVTAGDVVIGKLGSIAGKRGLALLRLDRAAEFEAQGAALAVGKTPVRIDPPAWLTRPKPEVPAQS